MQRGIGAYRSDDGGDDEDDEEIEEQTVDFRSHGSLVGNGADGQIDL